MTATLPPKLEDLLRRHKRVTIDNGYAYMAGIDLTADYTIDGNPVGTEPDLMRDRTDLVLIDDEYRRQAAASIRAALRSVTV